MNVSLGLSRFFIRFWSQPASGTFAAKFPHQHIAYFPQASEVVLAECLLRVCYRQIST